MTIRTHVVLAITSVILFVIVSINYSTCQSHKLIDAPIYAPELIDSITMQWDVITPEESEREPKQTSEIHDGVLSFTFGASIPGLWLNARINHPGDADHRYEVMYYLVSHAGKQFILASGPAPLKEFSGTTVGILGFARNPQKKIDWESARVWCEVRIFNEHGEVVFHGIKQSDLIPQEGLDLIRSTK